MIWLTWRQFRTQAIGTTIAIILFAILLAVTGPHLAGNYAASGIPDCHNSACGQLASNFLTQISSIDSFVYILGLIGIVLTPYLIGIFWGAPLIARELETGTFRFVWTQSVSRIRWLTIKVALTGMAAVTVTEALSLLHAWWSAPISQAARYPNLSNFPLNLGPFSMLAFQAHGITPVGYAAFAFMLGVAAGIVLRRTVPAMAAALIAFTVIQTVFPLAIRPNLFPASQTTITMASVQDGTSASVAMHNTTFGVTVSNLPEYPGAWIMSSNAVNAAGKPVSAIPASCRNSGEKAIDCIAASGIRIIVTYEPTNRYWPIQEVETGIYVLLTIILGTYSFCRVSRLSG